jgi:hypothetical protein
VDSRRYFITKPQRTQSKCSSILLMTQRYQSGISEPSEPALSPLRLKQECHSLTAKTSKESAQFEARRKEREDFTEADLAQMRTGPKTKTPGIFRESLVKKYFTRLLAPEEAVAVRAAVEPAEAVVAERLQLFAPCAWSLSHLHHRMRCCGGLSAPSGC